jgi:hypothetical protein
MPNQVGGDLLHTMSVTRLSRVRIEPALIRVNTAATSLHVDPVQEFEPSLSTFCSSTKMAAALNLRGDRSFLTLSS